MQRTLGFGISILLALVIAGPAHAQRAPDTATMDRGDGITRLGLDLGLTLGDLPYDTALRVEPYGQYVHVSGFGFYGALPISVSFGGGEPPVNNPEDTAAIGNLDLGGLYVVSGPDLSWVFRLGFALPTAGDDRDAIATNRFANYPRLTDLALAQPDAAYVRLGFTPLLHTGGLFLQADVGFDVAIDLDDSDGSDPAHLLRLNLGGGVDLGLLALGLELVNLASFDDVDDNEQFVSAGAFTIRFMGEALQPVVAVGLPLDDSARDDISVFFAGGIQFVFR